MEQNTIQLFRWAKELQNMAAAGIQYTTNDFDRERFLRIRDIHIQKLFIKLYQIMTLFRLMIRHSRYQMNYLKGVYSVIDVR